LLFAQSAFSWRYPASPGWGGALLGANNDWQDDAAQAAELTAAGLAPTNNLESGIAATLPPGLYTALLAGLNNGTGVGLVEVYDRGGP
jgi:hypothetical protein